MGRKAKKPIKATPQQNADTLALVISWFAMCFYGVLPTAGPYMAISMFYGFTLDNPGLGDPWPIVIRMFPPVFLLYRVYSLGRPSSYRIKIVIAIVFSMIGDFFFMNKDGDSFLTAMAMYAAMHVFIIAAMLTGGFSGIAFGIALCVGLSWALLLVNQLSESFIYLVPIYIILACSSLWRASAQPNLEYQGTKICALLATVFITAAHVNLSINAFGVFTSYDYLNVITIILFSMGQVMLGISTFDEVKLFAKHNIRRSDNTK